MYSSSFFDTCHFSITVTCVTKYVGVPTLIVFSHQPPSFTPSVVFYVINFVTIFDLSSADTSDQLLGNEF
jgi:hypothetical protein